VTSFEDFQIGGAELQRSSIKKEPLCKIKRAPLFFQDHCQVTHAGSKQHLTSAKLESLC
jgi:hypothetical protein